MQKEAIFFNSAHFIDYFANVFSFHDARERCVRCVQNGTQAKCFTLTQFLRI